MPPDDHRIRAFVDGLQPGIDPEKMNQLADELEAEELAGIRCIPCDAFLKKRVPGQPLP